MKEKYLLFYILVIFIISCKNNLYNKNVFNNNYITENDNVFQPSSEIVEHDNVFTPSNETIEDDNIFYSSNEKSFDKKNNISTNNYIYDNFFYSKASWYGSKFNGKKTASGIVFNKDLMYAAHKTLPFGTIIEVVNILNDSKTLVEIVDRGPYVKGRDIDLSEAAFKSISPLSKGVINIKYRILYRKYKSS